MRKIIYEEKELINHNSPDDSPSKSPLNFKLPTPKEKFMKMVKSLPEKARTELVYNYWNTPRSLMVCYFEVKMNTKLGDVILKDLGYLEEKK